MKKVYLLFFASALLVSKTNAQLVVFADNYGTGISFAAFGGSDNNLSIDATQHHSGTASLKIPVPATNYTGGALVADAPKNLSAYNAVTFWAKSDVAHPLNGVGLGNNATTTVYAVERNGVELTTTWTKYYIPIPVPSKFTAETGLFHFAESEASAYNIWIDDVQYENVVGGIIGTPTASFATESLNRSIGSTFNASATVTSFPVNSVNQSMNTSIAWFTWTSSNVAIAAIDALGVGSAVGAGIATITAKLGTVNATGLLTVTVAAASGGPATAAPIPTRNAAGVISLFSGAYTDVPGTTWFPNWQQTTVVTDVNIVGNPTKKYTNFNYQGVEFNGHIDASTMNFLHLDIWTPDCTTFDVYPIVPGQPEKAYSLKPILSGWNSFDIPLASIGTTGLNNIIQFKFQSTPFGGTNVWLDNIYFYNTILPISFTEFNVTRKNNTALLQWSTAFEQNNKGFSIERSTDGNSWKQINFINGVNASTVARAYTATDLLPVNGVNFYRIKQIDLDGHATYSITRSLSFEGVHGAKLALFPNPAKDKVAVTLGAIESSSAHYYIVSADGKVIKTGTFDKDQGNSVQTLDVSKIPRGVYIIKLTDGKTEQIAKLILN